MTTAAPLELKWTGPIARDGGREWTLRAKNSAGIPFHVVVFGDAHGFLSGPWADDAYVTTLELAKRKAVRGELDRQSKRLSSASQAIASLTAALIACAEKPKEPAT